MAEIDIDWKQKYLDLEKKYKFLEELNDLRGLTKLHTNIAQLLVLTKQPTIEACTEQITNLFTTCKVKSTDEIITKFELHQKCAEFFLNDSPKYHRAISVGIDPVFAGYYLLTQKPSIGYYSLILDNWRKFIKDRWYEKDIITKSIDWKIFFRTCNEEQQKTCLMQLRRFFETPKNTHSLEWFISIFELHIEKVVAELMSIEEN